MKRFLLQTIVRLKSLVGLKPAKVNVDEVIQDNLDLIKQIRMNRIKFYKYYKKSQSSC